MKIFSLCFQIQLSTGGGSAVHPPASVAASGGGSGRRSNRGTVGPLKPEQVAKLLSELDVVRRNMDIMNEVLSEVEPGKESSEDTQLLDVSLQTEPPTSMFQTPLGQLKMSTLVKCFLHTFHVVSILDSIQIKEISL